jgi:hypothetical protein
LRQPWHCHRWFSGARSHSCTSIGGEQHSRCFVIVHVSAVFVCDVTYVRTPRVIASGVPAMRAGRAFFAESQPFEIAKLWFVVK